MSTATKIKPQRAGTKSANRGKPDMKVFAARAAARLKAWYGNRIIADSGPLLDDLRKDSAS